MLHIFQASKVHKALLTPFQKQLLLSFPSQALWGVFCLSLCLWGTLSFPLSQQRLKPFFLLSVGSYIFAHLHNSPVLWCAFTCCVALNELVLWKRPFAVVCGLLCQAPVSHRVQREMTGLTPVCTRTRPVCTKVMVLGLGRTLTWWGVCMLFLETGKLRRKEAPLTVNDLVVLDREYCRYEPATKLLSPGDEMCFHDSERMDDWVETGCCFDSATQVFCFLSPLL